MLVFDELFPYVRIILPSTLIHTLDVFLGVCHRATGAPPGESEADAARQRHVNFLREMRYHIPRRHRDWLRALEKGPSVHGFIEELGAAVSVDRVDDGKQNEQMATAQAAIDAFNACVDQMKTFRDKHIQIVTVGDAQGQRLCGEARVTYSYSTHTHTHTQRYIVIQAQRAKQTGQEAVTGEGYHGMGPNADKIIHVDTAKPTARVIDERTRTDPLVRSDGMSPDNSGAMPPSVVIAAETAGVASDRGTGGTDIMPFLKQSRDETGAAAVRVARK